METIKEAKKVNSEKKLESAVNNTVVVTNEIEG